MVTWRQVAATRRGASRHSTSGRGQVGILLRNRPAHVAAFLGVLLGGGTVVVINPSRGDDRTRSRHRGAGAAVDHRRVRRPGIAGSPWRPTSVSISNLGRPHPLVTPGASAARRPPRGRGADADQRYDRSAEANRPHLRHAGAQRDRARSGPTRRPRRNCGRVSRSSTPRWCTSAACSGCCSVFARHGLSRCWTASSSISGPTPCAGIGPARCRWCPRPCAWCCTPI